MTADGNQALQRRQVMMDAVVALAPAFGLTAGACAALNVSRASVYRRRAHLAQPLNMHCTRPSPQRALSVAERRAVLGLLRNCRLAGSRTSHQFELLADAVLGLAAGAVEVLVERARRVPSGSACRRPGADTAGDHDLHKQGVTLAGWAQQGILFAMNQRWSCLPPRNCAG
jgi:hypothetical protein